MNGTLNQDNINQYRIPSLDADQLAQSPEAAPLQPLETTIAAPRQETLAEQPTGYARTSVEELAQMAHTQAYDSLTHRQPQETSPQPQVAEVPAEYAKELPIRIGDALAHYREAVEHSFN